MSTINIKGQEYTYDEREIVYFAEGLIGLPEIRRAVLVPMPECEPFCWLASLDDERIRFVVVNPYEIFDAYAPSLPAKFASLAPSLETLAIVNVSSDWRKTTFNLRAPIFINMETRRGVQFVLTESKYKLAETLPQT